jgi:hypothetical protein
MKKLFLIGLTVGLVIAATAVVFAATGGGQSATKAPKHRSHEVRRGDHRGGQAQQSQDRRGREAEPGDDRGNGEAEPGDDNGAGIEPGDDNGVDAVDDVSGPCDEAEHANDPQCTGVTVPAGDDDAGEVEDNSGPSANSGPGSSGDDSGDDSGSSGSGGGDDD